MNRPPERTALDEYFQRRMPWGVHSHVFGSHVTSPKCTTPWKDDRFLMNIHIHILFQAVSLMYTLIHTFTNTCMHAFFSFAIRGSPSGGSGSRSGGGLEAGVESVKREVGCVNREARIQYTCALVYPNSCVTGASL